MPIPAGPSAFHFRTRLLDAEGKPFADREYQIYWGNELHDGFTSPDGELEALLGGGIESGTLLLGETEYVEAGPEFIGYLSIPVRRVPPPPPPPEEIKVRPPKPPPVQPLPPNPEDSAAWEKYQRELVAWEKYQEQLQRERDEDEAREKERQDLEKQKAEADRRRAERPGSGSLPPVPQWVPPPATPQERAAELNRLNAEVYERYRVQYELFWRLRNLCYLTEEFRGHASWLLRGSDISRLALEAACQRYAHKHELTTPVPEDFALLPVPKVLTELLEHAKKTHDDLLAMNPIP